MIEETLNKALKHKRLSSLDYERLLTITDETQIERLLSIARKIRDENSRKEKFDLNNIFKDNIKNDIIENKDIIQEESLVDVHNIKWYEKIWKKITNLFKK